MARYSRNHAGARWGAFVEVKINIAEVLRNELVRRRKRSTALLSSVCDPYQPVEARYGLTRRCMEALRDSGWGIEILTRSPLVVRDKSLLASAARELKVSVGFSIPTDSDEVRLLVEPHAPPIQQRIAALKELHEAGIDTWVFIAPMLPMEPRKLYELISPHVGHVLIDALNYPDQVRDFFRKHHWDHVLTERYAEESAAELGCLFGDKASRV
jgi:DNA repair photolyase